MNEELTAASSTGGGRRIQVSVLAALRRLEDERVCWSVLSAGVTVYAAVALWIGRGTTLFVDEGSLFIQDRGFNATVLLTPFNGHLFLLRRLMFAADFKLFGPDFLVIRLLEVVAVSVVILLFFVLAKRRIGPAAALPVALLLLFFGSAWEVNFVLSGIGNAWAMAAGLGALLALDGRERRADLLACALLTVSVVSWTSGVAFAIGAGVRILLEPNRRRRLWIPALPLGLYIAWLAWVRFVYVPGHQEVQHLAISNALLIPQYFADELASVAGALVGLNHNFQPHGFLPIFSTDSLYGRLLAAFAIGAFVVAWRRGARSASLYALLSILAAFWIALALGLDKARNPTTARYVYEGAILVLLVGFEAARNARFSPRMLVALYAIAVLALGANLVRLREGVRFYRTDSASLRAQLTGVELARAHVDPSFAPAGAAKFAHIRAGPYLAAVDRIGSPAYSPADVASRPETSRHDVDAALVSALRLALTPSNGTERLHQCRAVLATQRPLSLRIGPPGVRLMSGGGGQVALRRFASSSFVPIGSLPAGRPVDLRIPADGSPQTWRLTVTSAATPVSLCRL